MSARTPICFHCRDKGLPFNHWSKNKPGPEGVVVCKVMLANRKCNYCKETGHLKAECPKLLLKQNPFHIAPKTPANSWASIAAAGRDAKLVAQIERETAELKEKAVAAKRALSEKKRQEYLEREARRQNKKRLAEEIAKAKEDAHIENMIEKWGSHRWFRMVEDTADDCRTACDIRYKKMEEEENEYYEMLEQEKKWQKEWEKQELEREEVRCKLEAETEKARRTMTQEEFEVWFDHNWDELIAYDDCDNYFDSLSYDYYQEERMRSQLQKEDATRLARWEAKQKAKK